MTVVSNCGVADKDRLINDNPNPNSNSNSTSAAQTQVNQKLQPSQEYSSANKSASSPMSSNPSSSARAYPVAFGAEIRGEFSITMHIAIDTQFCCLHNWYEHMA